jgi:hypothetical protein
MRHLLIAALLLPSVGFAEEAEEACALQGQMMGAVQLAYLDRVKQAKATEHVLAANPDWPAGAVDALPALVNYVYSLKRRQLKDVDLGAQTKTTCLENFEQIKKIQQTLTEDG